MFTRSESFDGVREGCMAIDALSMPFYSSGHPAVQVVGNPADGGIKEIERVTRAFLEVRHACETAKTPAENPS